MSINIMNFLKLAVVLFLCVEAPKVLGNEENYDLERITLTSGKVYRGIQILEGDRHGLLFRHETGIAKVPFVELSMNLRMLYEPVADVPGGEFDSEKVEPGEAFPGNDESENVTSKDSIPTNGWTWSIQARVYQVSRSLPCAGGVHGSRMVGFLPEYRVPWKSHWGPYPLALSLANPRYRALAVEDFLAVAFPLAHSCPPRTYPVPLRTYYSRY